MLRGWPETAKIGDRKMNKSYKQRLTTAQHLFEEALKTTAWVNEEDGKFYAIVGNEQAPRWFSTHDDALCYAKKIHMMILANHAAWIVGEGNEYRGVVGELGAYGN